MHTGTELGKIKAAKFGFGGYQDAQFGASFDLGGESWGVSDFWGYWGTDPSSHARWSKDDQKEHLGETCLRIRDLLKDAKKESFQELVGTPIEVTFGGGKLVSWRILKEVL